MQAEALPSESVTGNGVNGGCVKPKKQQQKNTKHVSVMLPERRTHRMRACVCAYRALLGMDVPYSAKPVYCCFHPLGPIRLVRCLVRCQIVFMPVDGM